MWQTSVPLQLVSFETTLAFEQFINFDTKRAYFLTVFVLIQEIIGDALRAPSI